MCRWVDNNIVTMVSNVHKGNEAISIDRKKPRVTQTNRKNLKEVWGDDYVRTIQIPKMIDDYNNTMNGVDKADQLISYYRPKLRCRRIWMPIMFHCLDLIRINSYIIVNSLGDGIQQKKYLKEMIEVLLARAMAEETHMTRLKSTSSLSSDQFENTLQNLCPIRPQVYLYI